MVHRWDTVEDSHCWAHYYAGEVFEEAKPRLSYYSGVPPVRYIVFGRHKDPDMPALTAEQARAVRQQGRAVFHYPPQRPTETADVVVYAITVGGH
jgi:hypothetical protein